MPFLSIGLGRACFLRHEVNIFQCHFKKHLHCIPLNVRTIATFHITINVTMDSLEEINFGKGRMILVINL